MSESSSAISAGGIILIILVALIVVATFVVVGWVLPIMLGLRTARRKNYSTLWMLFGIHPIGGWVAFIVLSCLPGRRRCERCGGFIAVHWKICPNCQAPVLPPAVPVSPSGTPHRA